MELYHTETAAERRLALKADLTHTPIGGAIELLPLCNMNCRMCYVRQTKEEMDAQGRMLTCDEWLRIAQEAWSEGTLYLLLTGGEPLLYPEFKRLYATLAGMGFVLQLNTNGTLINEEWADFFSKYGCRRLNITLYGKDDETYRALCRNPKGFSQVLNAARCLKERNVPFRLTCSVTPQNVNQLPELYEIARKLEVPLQTCSYMFPAGRRGMHAEDQYRLSPEEAGRTVVKCYSLLNPSADMEAASRLTIDSALNRPPKLKNGEGFSCRAGHSGFWMNWKGELQACGMFGEPKISMLEHTFKECWDEIVRKTAAMPHCEKCAACEWQNICQVCPACCYTEAGGTGEWPEYVCRMTHEMVRVMKNYIPGIKENDAIE